MGKRSAILFLTLALFAAAGPNLVSGAEPDSGAKDRARLYQAEVRAALVKHQWHVAAESPGILVTDHTLLDQVASPSRPSGASGYTRAVVKFKPTSRTDTACSASVLNYNAGYYLTSDVKKYHGQVPSPSDPSTVKMVEKLINDARARLTEAHPEYAKPAVRQL